MLLESILVSNEAVDQPKRDACRDEVPRRRGVEAHNQDQHEERVVRVVKYLERAAPDAPAGENAEDGEEHEEERDVHLYFRGAGVSVGNQTIKRSWDFAGGG